MAVVDNEQLARSIYEMFNAREFDRAASFVLADVEWVNVPFGARFDGPDGFRQFLHGWVVAMPDVVVDALVISPGEGSVVAEYTSRGTHAGPLMGPPGAIPPTGRRVEVRVCEVMQVRAGRVASGHVYFDAATMMRQLGLMSLDVAGAGRMLRLPASAPWRM
jgi:steroid delta-isomerase-like uncharacterized protein